MAGAGSSSTARGKLQTLLTNPVPEVRAAAVLAMSAYLEIGTCMKGQPMNSEVLEVSL